MALKKMTIAILIFIFFNTLELWSMTTPSANTPAPTDLLLGTESMPLPLIPIKDTDSNPLTDSSAQDPLSAFDEVCRQPSIISSTNRKQILDQKEKKHTKKRDKKKKQLTAQVPVVTVSLNFDVENQTGKTIYVTCFSYIKKRTLSRWRWDKSSIYKLEPKETATIDIDLIKDLQDRNSVFGYLAVLETEAEATEAIYELLDDRKKLDLDQLIHLQNKRVVVEVEKYGMVGEFYEYDFVKKNQSLSTPPPELDFIVENQTGKTVHVTCFVYQKKAKGTWLAQKTTTSWTTVDESRDDMSVWRFDKTPIITLKPGESNRIDVDTIIEPRDRSYVKGYLAVYDEDELKEADLDVYELLPPYRKLDLGNLSELKNKKIVLNVEKYGITGHFMDFVVKYAQHIDFSKFRQ